MICRFAKQYSVPRDEHVAVDVRRSCVDGGRTIEMISRISRATSPSTPRERGSRNQRIDVADRT